MAFSDSPLDIFFDLVPTGAALYSPVYDAGGELVDFRFARLNPAGQRLLGLPAQPPRTFREYYPNSVPTGIFDQYRTAYLTGQAVTYDVPYAGDGLDTYFRLVARRSGELLVVNFTDMADLPRVGIEQALRESQAAERAARAEAEAERLRLHQVLMRIPANLALLRGPEHIYALVNPEYERLFPARTTLGRSIREVIPDIAGQSFYELLDRVYETGESFHAPEAEAWADYAGTGEPQCRYYRTSFEPIRNVQGEVTEVFNFAVDVTALVLARRQVEQLNHELEARVQQRTQQLEVARAATERQRQQWENLLRRAPAAICIFDGPDWVYDFINPGYQAMFPGRELLGKRLVDALPEVADQPLMAILRHVYDTGETFEGQEVLVPLARTATGPVEDIYFDLTYQARTNEAGQINGFVTYAYDVTDRVRARRQLEQREASFRILADAAPAMLWVTDPAGSCTYLNAQWYLFTGQTEAQALGLGWTKAVHPDDAERAGQAFLDANARRVLFHIRYRLRRHDGVYRWATDTGWPRFTEDGEYAGIVGTVIDVHEQQLAEDELQASNEQLRRTNVDLDTFIYTASHDLKAPIANIESIVLALRATLPPAVQQAELVAHLLALLDSTVARFQFTIAQLTDISRLQLAHVGAAEPVGLAQVVEAVRLDLAPAIVAAETRLTVAVDAALVVSFSPANLRSIVYNLLSNAVKYHAPGRSSWVQVRAAQTPHALLLTVQDNGLGMSEVQQRQLFGLFQRLHTHVEGTGVGLYITKRLVENAGGTISVHSQPNVGTTFTVSFPI